jgi:formylglycine-generating enzyme
MSSVENPSASWGKAVVVLAFAVAGCSGSDNGAGAAGASNIQTPCGATTCGSLEDCWNDAYCVAKSVPVATPGGGQGYTIDATEVTWRQYKAWVDTHPSTTGQDPWCSWNTSFEPNSDWPSGLDSRHPVAAVNWCDAFAYCKAVGKRLCGKIGGGPLEHGDGANPSLSQWYNACSSGGVNAYPYGNDYQPTTCNSIDLNTDNTRNVGTLAGCVSSVPGYTGVYDLSGNVWEWEDSCLGTKGEQDRCQTRGGAYSYDMAGANAACITKGIADADRSWVNDDVGFRCCSQ